MKLLAGNSNPKLADAVANYLGTSLARSEVKRFSDLETSVRIYDNMRGQDVFVIQSTCTPANDHLMELLITLDALKRASPKRVTAVMPYFGYARQDRKNEKKDIRTAISAKMVADLLTAAGADRILTMDLHAGQIEGFFNLPVDNLTAMPTLADDIRQNYHGLKPLIVSPDVGGVVRARALADKLHAPLAIVDKRRPEPNVSEVMNIIGEVDGFDCILFDDMVDTAGTLTHAADALLERGAASVSAYVSHGVLSGPAFERLGGSKLREVVITDSIPLGKFEPDDLAAKAGGIKKVRVCSVANLFGEAIRRIVHEESVSRLSL